MEKINTLIEHRKENMMMSLKAREDARKKEMESSPKPDYTSCLYCGRRTAPYWDDIEKIWKATRVHDDCVVALDRMTKSDVGKIFWKLPEFEAGPGNERALKATDDFINNPYKKGLFLWGSSGTGKTHLAVKVLQEVLPNEAGIRFVKVPKLIMDLTSNFGPESYKNKNVVDELINAEVLILDDLGAEKPSEWVAEILYIILDERYSNQKPTVITSNYDLGIISERLGDRISSRIMAMCRVIQLSGDDKRKPSKK